MSPSSATMRRGKSNFLEAIYYPRDRFAPFGGARDAQMVSFGDDVFRVVGTTQGGADEPRGAQIAAAFQKKGKRKKVSIDGVEPDRLTDALGHFSAVIFSPADVDLVQWRGRPSGGAFSTSSWRSTSPDTSARSQTTRRASSAGTPRSKPGSRRHWSRSGIRGWCEQAREVMVRPVAIGS